VFAAQFATGSTATAANLVLTDTTNFNRILGAGNTTVQSALETLDDGAAKSEVGDLIHTSFTPAQSTTNGDVTGLVFNGAAVRSFRAQVSVSIIATTSLFETVMLEGIYTGTDWLMTQTGTGNDSLVTFSITSAGQVQYTTPAYSGFSGTSAIKFRAWVTLV
jgi:hypothetical protein